MAFSVDWFMEIEATWGPVPNAYIETVGPPTDPVDIGVATADAVSSVVAWCPLDVFGDGPNHTTCFAAIGYIHRHFDSGAGVYDASHISFCIDVFRDQTPAGGSLYTFSINFNYPTDTGLGGDVSILGAYRHIFRLERTNDCIRAFFDGAVCTPQSPVATVGPTSSFPYIYSGGSSWTTQVGDGKVFIVDDGDEEGPASFAYCARPDGSFNVSPLLVPGMPGYYSQSAYALPITNVRFDSNCHGFWTKYVRTFET